jgi:hypothetical protein
MIFWAQVPYNGARIVFDDHGICQANPAPRRSFAAWALSVDFLEKYQPIFAPCLSDNFAISAEKKDEKNPRKALPLRFLMEGKSL